jgi:hypothetical protein
MDEAPGLWEILSNWSFDIAWTAALVVSGGWYLRATRTLAMSVPRVAHPGWRTLCFMVGLLLVAMAVMSPLHAYGNDLLWVNFSGFLVLSMLAPPLLVLGAPLTLAFRVADSGGRRRLRVLYRSRVAQLVTFPVAAWLLFAAVTYAWQFSSLTEVAARSGSCVIAAGDAPVRRWGVLVRGAGGGPGVLADGVPAESSLRGRGDGPQGPVRRMFLSMATRSTTSSRRTCRRGARRR